MKGEKFKIVPSEIPKEVVHKANTEAKQIYNSSYAKHESLSSRPRDFDDILKDTLLGKIGEYFITSRFGYTEDDDKYHDLLSPTGESTEVKTWRKEFTTEYSIYNEVNRISKRKKDQPNWFFSTKMIVILYDKTINELEIYDIYDI